MTSDTIKREPDTVEDTPQVRFGSSVKFSVVFYNVSRKRPHSLVGVSNYTPMGGELVWWHQPQIFSVCAPKIFLLLQILVKYSFLLIGLLFRNFHRVFYILYA